MASDDSAREVEQWECYELALDGPSRGNPFLDVEFGAVFRHDHRTMRVSGSYDGEGVYRLRFMPEAQGRWEYETRSNCPDLNGASGSFVCIEPGEGNHGPVGVRDTYHFAYADGTPYYQVGTTCYAWAHQGDELEEQTLETLREAPFNKLRMCVFPKRYVYNRNEPVFYPFQRNDAGTWDFERFDPAFFRHFEKRVRQLMELGIEADLILFHPYDGGHWGFDRMDAATDDRYLRHLAARLAAFRNVWWSMANEWDLMRDKAESDWDRFFRVVQESDPYQHLRSIHNCRRWYDHGKPWVTHVSVQSGELERMRQWREEYGKPVVVDECVYEGNIPQGWGNLTAEELVRRFWTGTIGGGYVGHGETYLHPDDVLWWSKGGLLHGKSPERIAFLGELMQAGPQRGFEPLDWGPSWELVGAGKGDEYCLFYWGDRQPARYTFELPEGTRYRAEVVDTWQMTIEPVKGVHEGKCTFELPGKPYVAIRLQSV